MKVAYGWEKQYEGGLIMNDRLTVLKGLHEARCLLEDRVPARYRGKALEAVCDAIAMISSDKTLIENQARIINDLGRTKP